MPAFRKVRVNDKELGIITYWNVRIAERRVVSFEKQLGERL